MNENRSYKNQWRKLNKKCIKQLITHHTDLYSDFRVTQEWRRCETQYLYCKSYIKSESQNSILASKAKIKTGKVDVGQDWRDGWGQEGQSGQACGWMLNNLIMSQLPSPQQKRQRILNYEIRLIEECPDSLFNCSTCTHDRYLEWGLARTLRAVIGDAPHKLRWMGNDRNSPLYAYIYIAITACSQEPSLMVQLKTSLYSLAERYLAVFEQKLLIEFLCLLEYSHEKHLFFRKYASIERILIRIFGEVQRRAPPHPLCNSQENTFSKLTTCITSPCRSQEEQCGKMEQSNRAAKQKWVWLLQTYSQNFPFIKIEQLGDYILKVSVEVQRTSTIQDYYVCVEKECFFVAEAGQRPSSANSYITSSIQENPYSRPCPYCLKGRSSRQEHPSSKINSSRNDLHQFTPKFISSKKKKVSINGPDFYNDHNTSKKVNVEVLDVADFEEKASAASESNSGTLHYKKRIDNLSNINATIKSIDLQRTNPHADFRTRPIQQQFGSKERQVQTQQAIPARFPIQYAPASRQQQQKPHFFAKKYSNQPAQQNSLRNNKPLVHNPQQTRKVNSNEKGSRETLLSASNLRKFLKPSVAGPLPAVRFHSHSPRSRPQALSPLKPRLPLLQPIKFTYC